MNKKPSKSFKEYDQRWYQTASQVQLALTGKENVTIFMSTMSSTYYHRFIGQVGASFVNLVQTEERIQDGLKAEKFKDYQKLFEQSSNNREDQPIGLSPIRGMIKMRRKFTWSLLQPFDIIVICSGVSHHVSSTPCLSTAAIILDESARH